jgi:hypothetical protein
MIGESAVLDSGYKENLIGFQATGAYGEIELRR